MHMTESVHTWPTINQLLIECSLSVDRASFKCRPSIDWDVDRVLSKMSIEGIGQQLIADAIGSHDPYTIGFIKY